MFLFKKIIGPFFDPLSICLIVFALGLLMLWFTKKQRAGRILVSIGFIFLVLTSYTRVPALFIKPLESQYPSMLTIDRSAGVKWIVVLGGGVAADTGMPPNSQLTAPSLARLIEGVRIHNLLPQTRLLVSGGPVYTDIPEAEVMAKTALSLGIDPKKLVVDTESIDTEEQALLIKKVIGTDPFILVTSAYHMPRSVALAKKLGLHPIPAPTDHANKNTTLKTHPAIFFPNAANIQTVESATHEYLGLIWSKLRGKI